MPHQVHLAERRPQAGATHQCVALALHGRPVVQRVAPALAGAGEDVRRHAGHGGGAAVAVEQEQVRVGPHVRRVARDVDRQVADQFHAPGVGVLPQRRQLAEEQELREAVPAERRRPDSRRALARAAGLRKTRSFGHSASAAAVGFASAMNRAKSSSQSASAAQNSSNSRARSGRRRRVIAPTPGRQQADLNGRRARSPRRPESRAGIRAVRPGPSGVSRPSRSRAVGADQVGVAGEGRVRTGKANCPSPAGPSGRICHQVCPARARASTHRNAAGPRSPMP